MRKFSRRGLFKRYAAGAGAALVWPGWRSIQMLAAAMPPGTGPDVKFPTDPRERLAVATWPFRAFIDMPAEESGQRNPRGMSLQDFAVRVKKEFNVPGVEPLSTHFASTEEHYLHGFREAIEKAGVHVVNIPVSNKHSYYDPDAANRKQAFENGRKWIDVAVLIGSPSVRTSIAWVEKAKPDVDLVAEQLKSLADYGASKNVVVNLENDDLGSEDAFFIVKVIQKVNHPYLHALPDFCNSMVSGNEKFNYDAVAALFPLAYNICHVKDAETGEGGKVYRVDMKKTFGILKASGYRGYCSMEWEGESGPYEGTKELIKSSLQELAY